MSEIIGLDTKFQRRPDLVAAAIDDANIFFDSLSGKYFAAERVAKRIWELAEQPLTIRALCGQLLEEYSVESDKCESDTLLFVEEMNRSNLIIIVNDPTA